MRRNDDRLTPAERQLWRRVAATVRPMHEALPPPPPETADAPPAVAPSPAPPTPAVSTAAVARMRPPPRAMPPHPEDATLDGGWDRRMRGGRIEPDRVIDLHGHGVEEAHWLVEHCLRDAAADGARVVLIVTGKGSRGPEDRRGVIRASLADWLQLSRLRPLIAAMRPAHPRHGGAGAFYVVLRRPR